ncbi:MAG TPA: hypothetical protein VFS62_09110, partial [Chloroflexota bacterium]|nr:hypothetical protein [Chloroflexota bacterium]
LVNAPPDFESELVPLPDGIRLDYEESASLPAAARRSGEGGSPDPTQLADVIVAFFAQASDLHAHFDELAKRLTQNGGLWLCWIKKASGILTDLTETDVRATGLDGGLVDNKTCAVTDIWSGLRFVYRLKDRR